MIDPSRCKVVSFDCAQTLLQVSWNPGRMVVLAAQMTGLELDVQVAHETYMRMLGSRFPEYKAICLTRDAVAARWWWRDLTVAWLERLGLPITKVEEIGRAAEEIKYQGESPMFSMYEDVVPALKALGDKPLMVISNWDTSIHEFLNHFGIAHFFKVIAASDEYGVEKPDSLFFEAACRDMGVEPDEVLHVGDSYLDDVAGARAVGMQALHLDRGAKESQGLTIRALTEVPGFLGL